MGRRKFTQEFKLEAVRLLTAGHRSAAGIARELGINSSLLYKWKRQLEEDAEAAFPGKGHLKPEEEELRRLRRELEDARQEISFPKKNVRVLRQPARARFAVIRESERAYRVRRMCAWLEVSASGYYAWRRRPESRRDRENRRLLVSLRALHRESRQSYGSPQMQRALENEGWRVGRHRIARLMRQDGLWGQRRKRFRVTTQVNGKRPVAPDRLERQFNVAAANRAWVSDISYVWTQQGWLYLACILDLYSRRIVGWAARGGLTTDLVLVALTRAVHRRRPGPGLIFHSDRGTQYTSGRMACALAGIGAVASMGSKGDCFDNAVMERFFGSLKSEWVGKQSYETREHATRDLAAYIEGFYDSRRPHSTLAGFTPAAFENQMAVA